MAPIKPPIKRRRSRELGPHLAIFRYLSYVLPPDWLVHHSPNQGHGRSKKQGGILKAMGVKAGFPDLICLGDDGMLPTGFFVEVKSATGSRSEAQRKFGKWAEAHGWPVIVARNIDEVRAGLVKHAINHRDLGIVMPRAGVTGDDE